MRSIFRKVILPALAALGMVLLAFGAPIRPVVLAQQPTGSVPTVTSTPIGPFITVSLDQEQINVRAGPNTYMYPAIGVLLAGQSAPAIGRSPGGEWIQILYPGVPGGKGWVYAPLVKISPGANLPIVEPPPTPTPVTTPTIDPTQAAAFVVPATSTRLPTFTAAPPVVIPTFTETDATAGGGLPMGLLIFGLGFIGVMGAIISALRGR
ncbi:MAG: SH3 domain-containing protein [Candidatus Villigracilaceae bacterium]